MDFEIDHDKLEIKNCVPKFRLTEDEKATIHYKGRRFEIISDGTYAATKVLIDGVEQKDLVDFKLFIDPFREITIELTYHNR